MELQPQVIFSKAGASIDTTTIMESTETLNDPVKAVVLSSSLLTERIFLYSSFLEALKARVKADLWTTSAKNLHIDQQALSSEMTVDSFPAVKPFKQFPYTYLRRLNEYVWDYRLKPPSRMGMIKEIRDRNTRFHIRTLYAPARILAALRMEQVLEDWLEEFLLTYPRSPESKLRLESNPPDVVLSTGSFRFEEPAVAAEARKLNIPTLAFITSWDNPSTKNRMVYKYDGYLVWSEIMKQDMHHFFKESREVPVYITGAPQFDVFFQQRFYESREDFCARNLLSPDKPFILYALGSPNLFLEEASIYYLAKRVAEGELGDVQLLIRPHPLHDKGLDAGLFKQLGPRIIIQDNGQGGLSVPTRAQTEQNIHDWVNTFRHCALLVNLSSTAAIDAAIFDKPIINLDYDPEPGQSRQRLVKEINHTWTHFKPVVDSGGMLLVNDDAEMVEAVKTYLLNPGLHREERRRMAEMVCGFLDGRCGERMVDAILDFAEKEKEKKRMNELS